METFATPTRTLLQTYLNSGSSSTTQSRSQIGLKLAQARIQLET